MTSLIAGLQEAYGRLARSYKSSYQGSSFWGKALLILIPAIFSLCLLALLLTFLAPEPLPTPEDRLAAAATEPVNNVAELRPTEPAMSPTRFRPDRTPEPSPTRPPAATPKPTSTNTATAYATATETATPTRKPTATETPQPPTVTMPATAPPQPAIPDGQLVTVQQIIDGDTIEVLIDGQAVRVQYIGVDTPEWDEPLFAEASSANDRLVAGQAITLVKDVSEVDPYDRLLRYVYLQDGTFVNAELVRLGFARAATYPPDVAHQALFAALEAEARGAALGIWGQAAQATAPPATAPAAAGVPAEAPPAPQPGDGSITIVAVDKGAEYADLLNGASQPADLTGWILRSEKGYQDCPLAVVIQPGETLRVWALTADAGQGGYNCGFDSNIWNNSEPDPAVLIDAQGVEVARYP